VTTERCLIRFGIALTATVSVAVASDGTTTKLVQRLSNMGYGIMLAPKAA